MCVIMLYYGVISLPDHDVHQSVLGLDRLTHPHVCGFCTVSAWGAVHMGTV